MATRLYLAHDVTSVFDPSTRRGAWDSTASADIFRLATTRTGQGENSTASENSATNNFDVLVAVFVSDPLKDAVTIAGTLSGALLTAEANADANFVLHVHAWVTQGDSGTARGTLLTDFIDTTEWAVSTTQVAGIAVSAQALSSVAASAGDRIVLELGYQAQNTHTTSRAGLIAVGGRTGTDANGSEALQGPATSNHGWFELSTDVAFASTYLYTTNAVAPVTPGGNVGAWDVDNKADLLLGRTKSGATTSRAVAETSTTNPTDGLVHRFVSDELAAQTITATTIDLMLRMTENATDADAFQKVHLYVMKPDGTSRGNLLANNVGGTELSTSLIQRVSGTLSSLAVLSGDRLVLEVGARFTNVTATSKNIDHHVGNTVSDIGFSALGNATASSAGWSGWIRFAQRLIWLDEVAAGFAFSQVVIVG